MPQSTPITPVPTAIPAFIGYTEKAVHNGQPLSLPLLISNLQEYEQYFGAAPQQTYAIVSATGMQVPNTIDFSFDIGGQFYKIAAQRFYMYDSLRMFFNNGGEACYIVSTGHYQKNSQPTVIDKDELYEGLKKLKAIDNLRPTLLLMPDALNLPANDYYELAQQMLVYCGQSKNCMALLDVHEGYKDLNSNVVEEFRTGVGNQHLMFGASYYPFLNTNLFAQDDINYSHIDQHSVFAKNVGAVSVADLLGKDKLVAQLDELALLLQKEGSNKKTLAKIKALDLELKTKNTDYFLLINKITEAANTMPPCPAVAGVYNQVDNSRGVWKAPANVNITSATGPTVSINNNQQEDLNVDVVAGKSINAIRTFTGVGSALIWGARTLAGNDNEWRYVPVRRFLNMVEQSIIDDTRSMVFEPNDANTWANYRNRINVFLNSLWRQGALAGPAPDDAFFVRIGLNETMTENDIQNGLMIINVGVAQTRPAEFIVLRIVVQMAL